MGGINGDCRSQRVARALEAGFENVVGIFPCKLYKVERSGHIAGKAQPELRGAFHIEIAHLFGLAVDITPPLLLP